MSYYTAPGEPPGEWAGQGAAALGLSGQVDPGGNGRLYQQNIGPGGNGPDRGDQAVRVGLRHAAAGRRQWRRGRRGQPASHGPVLIQVPGADARAEADDPAVHGEARRPPSKRTIWLLGQQAAQNTRRTKAEARRTVAGQTGAAEPRAAQRLAAWETQTVRAVLVR